MASYQFTCVAVPRGAWDADPHDHPEALIVDGTERWWTSVAIDDLHYPLQLLGSPNPDHWNKDTTCWGSDDQTAIYLSHAEDGIGVEDVRLRLDLRSKTAAPIVRAFLAVARTADWVLITEAGELIPPALASLRAAAAKSPAARFVADPNKFLDELDHEAIAAEWATLDDEE